MPDKKDNDEDSVLRHFKPKHKNDSVFHVNWPVLLEFFRPYLIAVFSVVISAIIGLGSWFASRTFSPKQEKLSPRAELHRQRVEVPWEFGHVSDAKVNALKEAMRPMREELRADRLFFDLVNPEVDKAIVIAQVSHPNVPPLAGFFQRATLKSGELFKIKTSLVTQRGHILFREESVVRTFEQTIREQAPHFEIKSPEFGDPNVRRVYPDDNWRRLVVEGTNVTVLDYSYVGSDPSMRTAMEEEGTRLNLYIPVFQNRQLVGILVANLTDNSFLARGEVKDLPAIRDRMFQMGTELAEIVL